MADGADNTTITLTVLNQWREPYDGPATVQITANLAPTISGDDAADAGLITSPLPLSLPNGRGEAVYQAGRTPGEVTLNVLVVNAAGEPPNEATQATLRLLEAATLNDTAHLYADSANAAASDDSNIVLFRMPVGTPLSLFPPDDAFPGVRRAAVRVWLPDTVVAGPGATTLVDPIPTNTRALIGDTPADGAPNSQQSTDQILSSSSATIRVLGEAIDGYYQVEFIVWVNEGELATEDVE